MKLQKLLVIPALAAVLTFTVSSFAAKGGGKKSPGPDFATLDKDSKGFVTKDEFAAGMKDTLDKDAAEARFATLDKDGNGKLTSEEFAAGKKGKKKK